MKKWQLVKIQLKTPDHLLPSWAAKSRNDQQKFLGSWWIVMKRRKNWTRGVKCSPNYIPIIHPFIFAIRTLYWNSEEEVGVIIVWDRDIIVMNSPILVAATTLPPCTTQHCCTHCTTLSPRSTTQHAALLPPHCLPRSPALQCTEQHCSAQSISVHRENSCTVQTTTNLTAVQCAKVCTVQTTFSAPCKLVHCLHNKDVTPLLSHESISYSTVLLHISILTLTLTFTFTKLQRCEAVQWTHRYVISVHRGLKMWLLVRLTFTTDQDLGNLRPTSDNVFSCPRTAQ